MKASWWWYKSPLQEYYRSHALLMVNPAVFVRLPRRLRGQANARKKTTIQDGTSSCRRRLTIIDPRQAYLTRFSPTFNLEQDLIMSSTESTHVRGCNLVFEYHHRRFEMFSFEVYRSAFPVIIYEDNLKRSRRSVKKMDKGRTLSLSSSSFRRKRALEGFLGRSAASKSSYSRDYSASDRDKPSPSLQSNSRSFYEEWPTSNDEAGL